LQSPESPSEVLEAALEAVAHLAVDECKRCSPNPTNAVPRPNGSCSHLASGKRRAFAVLAEAMSDANVMGSLQTLLYARNVPSRLFVGSHDAAEARFAQPEPVDRRGRADGVVQRAYGSGEKRRTEAR
jgi:hypothetical protein